MTNFVILSIYILNIICSTGCSNQVAQHKYKEIPEEIDSKTISYLENNYLSTEFIDNTSSTDKINYHNYSSYSTKSSKSDEFNLNSTDKTQPHCIPGSNALGNLIPIILYSVVCIIGLFGNTLVIYVVLRFSKMQTVTNMYILNLAIADECFLIGIPFLLTTMHLRVWKFGEYMCKAYMVSTSITQFTSSIFLLIMSADRYIAVCHPISSPRYRTPFVSKIVSCIAWIISIILMIPVILFANIIEHDEHISCNIKWPAKHNTESGTTFILYTLILGFATPLCFILCFYYLVIRKLHTVGPKNKSKEKKRSHRKVTKLVLTVITVYILCWLPYWISQVALINSPLTECASSLEITMFLLVGCLGYSNSAMNPILYAFLSDNFKKSFLKACTCNNGIGFIFTNFRRSRNNDHYFNNKTSKHNQQHSKLKKQPLQSSTDMLDGDEEGEQTAMTFQSKSVIRNHPESVVAIDEGPPVLHTDL